MRKAALIVLGGGLMALALYLFPLYYGQELFVSYLEEQTGGDYQRAVVLAGLIAGGLAVLALLLMRPQYLRALRQPVYLIAAVAVAVVLYAFVVGGL